MIDVKKMRELARRLLDTQADCADSIEAADAIVTLCDRLEAAEKDAERYRALRRGQHWSVLNGIGDTLRADELDAAIDAALAQRQGEGS